MSNFDLQINKTNKGDLLVAAKWAKVLAIFGYVVMGIMVFASIILLVGGKAMDMGEASNPMKISTNALAVLYLMIAAFYYFPVTFMYKMSRYLKLAIENTKQDDLDKGIGFLAKFFKFSGYMTIGIIAFYIVILVGAIIVGVTASLV